MYGYKEDGREDKMPDIHAMFSEELKRFCSRWNVIFWIVLSVMVLAYGARNISEFKAGAEKEKILLDIQNLHFEATTNYQLYGVEGIKTLFVPSAISIFFGDAVIPPDVGAKFDSIVSLSIYNNLKGKSVAAGTRSYITGFSDIVLLILTLLGLYYGYESMQQREYLKFRTAIKSRKKIFLAVIGSKFMLFVLAFVILVAIQILQMIALGIPLSSIEYSNLFQYLKETTLLLLIFFSSGVIIGALRMKGFYSAISIFTIWFALIFIFPGGLNWLLNSKLPDSMKDYQTELEKYSVLMDFEKSFKDKHGKFSRSKMDVAREYIEKYWNVVYKEIKAREEKLRNEFAEAVDEYNFLSIFSPVNNYLLTCSEISSRGHQKFLDYYRFNQELQEKFVRFYIDRTFYNDPKIMVNFLDNEDPIYHAKSTLPKYFHWGLLVNALYCLILLLISYYHFCRYLYPKPKNAEEFRQVDLHFEKGKAHIINSPGEDFSDQFTNIFFGMDKYFTGKITIDGKNILDGQKKVFTYLPDIKDFPEDIPIKSIVKLFDAPTAEFSTIYDRKFGDLKETEQANLLLTCALNRKSSIYLLNNFFFAPVEYLETYKQKIDALKETGVLIYIARSVNISFQSDWNKYIVFDPVEQSYKKMREPGDMKQ
ncbi:MAG: hypothetical protein QG657_3998 [Acidobacteriota bacterium]|nr:hypothetical protein [Acidobacteriota bacterium]